MTPPAALDIPFGQTMQYLPQNIQMQQRLLQFGFGGGVGLGLSQKIPAGHWQPCSAWKRCPRKIYDQSVGVITGSYRVHVSNWTVLAVVILFTRSMSTLCIHICDL
ncbi:hypothetical protein LXA43DRAFT_1111221 [Ganoderma leucocontextum]|nr:hypothetical protein LXA43DRAFT_1111221 [Ganoderma leucocontextum]